MEFIYMVSNAYGDIFGLFADEETACQNAKSICEEIGVIIDVIKAPVGTLRYASNEEFVASFKAVGYGDSEKIVRMF